MTDVLIASDADWIIEDVKAALVAPGVDIRVVRAGKQLRIPDSLEPDNSAGFLVTTESGKPTSANPFNTRRRTSSSSRFLC